MSMNIIKINAVVLHNVGIVEYVVLFILFVLFSAIIRYVGKVKQIKKSTYITTIQKEEFIDVYNEYFNGIKQLNKKEIFANRKYAKKMKRKTKTKADRDTYYYKERVIIYTLGFILLAFLSSFVYERIDDKHNEKVALENDIHAFTDKPEQSSWEFYPQDIPSLSNDEQYLDYLLADGKLINDEILSSTKGAEAGLYTIRLVDVDKKTTVKISDTQGRNSFILTDESPQIVNVFLNDEMEINVAGADVELVPQKERVKYKEDNPKQGYYIYGKDYTNPVIDNEALIKAGYNPVYTTIYNNNVFELNEYDLDKYDFSEVVARPGFSQVVSKEEFPFS